MQAVTLFSEGPDLRVIEKNRPSPTDGEDTRQDASRRDRRVGQADRCRRDQRRHPRGGGSPRARPRGMGVVEDPNGTELGESEVVAPMVRRPADGGSQFAEE